MAVTAPFLKRVKDACGIASTFYDVEVTSLIEAARLEMIRIGVKSDIANAEDNPLVYMAVRTYCKVAFAETETDADRLSESFIAQARALSLSDGYKA